MEMSKNDELVFKLLHYFITNKGYNPVILHGAKDEIWLENLNSDYKIVRLVSNYIHNNEQLETDLFRTNQIMKTIKKKTLSIKAPVLSIFLNTGDNVDKSLEGFNNITCVFAKKIGDLTKYKTIEENFPDISKKTDFAEDGFELFAKITTDINKKTEIDSKQAEDIFKPKKPIVTYILIIINVLVFIYMYIFTDPNVFATMFANHRYYVRQGEIYRLVTSAFLHGSLLHLLFNCYALYIIGSQVESFFGKTKYIIIYFGSAIMGSLLSICATNNFSLGASGAIFGLLGAILYFGYHYRIYLGNVIKSQIIPVIVLNLALGFAVSGIDNAAHIGGLIGGILMSMICGIKYNKNKRNRINGIIMTLILLSVLIYLGIFG